MSEPGSSEKPSGSEYLINSPQVPQPPQYRQQALNELIERPALPPAFLETLPDRNDKRVRMTRRWIIALAIILLLLFTAVLILSILLAFAKKTTTPVPSNPLPVEGPGTITQVTTQSATYTTTQTSWNTSTLLTKTTAWSTTSVSASSSTSSSSSLLTKTVSETTTIDPTYDVTTSTIDKTVSIAHTTKTTTLDASTESVTDVSTSTDIVSASDPLVFKPTIKMTTAMTLSSTADPPTETLEYPNSASFASLISVLVTAASGEPTTAPQPDCDTDPLVLANNFCVMVNSCNATSADIQSNDCKDMCRPGLGKQLCSLDKAAHPREYDCCNKCGCREGKTAGGMVIGT